MKSNITQTTAIGTVAKSLPQNKVILLNRLISNSYIPYTDLRKFPIPAPTAARVNCGMLFDISCCIMTDTTQAIIKKEKIASESDGLEISILLCGPAAGTPKGIVQIVHGMCEHKERYIPFMEYLAANGFFSIIHDHRGHGESVRCSEDLGYFYEGGWTAMIDDIKAVTGRVRMEHPDLPLILLGHSMGRWQSAHS